MTEPYLLPDPPGLPDQVAPPAPRPCVSCPYRRDVPSGVWDPEEYRKLPAFDNDTWAQPPRVFLCHQQDGRVCAGWAGCHDMDESMGLRIAGASGLMTVEAIEATRDYVSPVPLFATGAQAAAHGLAEVEAPPVEAVALAERISRKRAASSAPAEPPEPGRGQRRRR